MFLYMLPNFFLNLLRNEDFARGRNRCNFNANHFLLSQCYLLVSMNKKSTRFHGSILMWLESLEPPQPQQFSLHASQFAFKYVEIEHFATGWNCCNFYFQIFFRSMLMLSFGQYEMKSSEATPLLYRNEDSGKGWNLIVSFMTTLVAGKVATVEDSMFTAKINNSPCFKFHKLKIRFTSLLLLS